MGVEALRREQVLGDRPLAALAALLPAQRFRTTAACPQARGRVCLFATAVQGDLHVVLLADERSQLVLSVTGDSGRIRDALLRELLTAE